MLLLASFSSAGACRAAAATPGRLPHAIPGNVERPAPLHRHPRRRSARPSPAACAAAPSASAPPSIQLVATDVDGTLLNSKQELQPRVIAAIKAAAAAGVPLVVATGKARGPWVSQVFQQLSLQTPGVFLQGLLVCNADGSILTQQELPHDVAHECIRLADAKAHTLIAYANDRILSASLNQYTEVLKFYKEPTVEAVGHMSGTVGKVPFQKVIFMGTQQEMDDLRTEVDERLQGRASTTTAVPGMLEVLPLGASKGAGLAWLLEHMGVAPSSVMALGDGENDLEMLQLVGLGVAMGNAGPRVRATAKEVVAGHDEDGVAEAIERFVLQPRGLSSSYVATTSAATATGS